jgi:hypothetical protein
VVSISKLLLVPLMPRLSLLLVLPFNEVAADITVAVCRLTPFT